MKVSFLIPAHNEEIFIGKCLRNLLDYKRDEDEIIVGLDACTDNTELIVSCFGGVNYIKSKKKLGKHGVLQKMIEKAKGEIIIIHDADWLFVGEKSLDTLIKYFDNKKIGGIANSFSSTNYELEKGKGIGYIGDALCDEFLIEFKKKYFTKKRNGILFIDREKMHFPFFVNVIRRNLIREAKTVADDLERVFNVWNKGYEIVILEDEEIPHDVVIYKYISIGKLYYQKVRGHLARKQIRHGYNYSTNIRGFYIPITIFMVRKMLKIRSLKMIIAMFMWMSIAVISYFHALVLYSLKPLNTKNLWKMRVR